MTWMRQVGAEAVGTFALVFLGAGAVLVDASGYASLGALGISLAFGFVVLLVVYAIGHVSGAHINPAVTVGFWAIGRFPGRLIVPYVLGQLIGATMAAALLSWLLDTSVQPAATGLSVSLERGFVVEFLLTCFLMFVITAVATDDRVADGVAGVSIGLAVAIGALFGGGLTGASMNPARSFGPAVVSMTWDWHWLYWVAPILGALTGAHVYGLLRSASPPSTMDEGRVHGVLGPIDEQGRNEVHGATQSGRRIT